MITIDDSSSAPLRVILVDDNPARANAVAEGLARPGLEILSVIPTASGLLYQMAQQEPDVVVIALDSPDRDVLESLSIASTHNPRPVVMFSGSGDSGFIGEAIRAGVTAYQAEDINPERVQAVIDVAMAQFSAFNDLRLELDRTRQQLADRKLVEKAKGLICAIHGVDEEEAFSTLRKLAMDQNQTLGEVAGNVIAVLEKSRPERKPR
ncbi:ANTAR domain-containing protein [Parahaliea maris]|uniref:ANTAR domain-containing protein n=1 Tax=Parahaliea maris TaxID=2716870 RepID=A0A5C9A3G5_9GAMM|nr:ANTAR domain-containing protein [Parahaliea maris]TXS95415.1 ANTAR domain-containing protein [Parahaliea maris]